MNRQYTEREVIDVIMRDRWMSNFCLPNYTPPGWWECDVFEITPAGFFREYEVKLSVADFRADRNKAKDIPKSGRWEGQRYVHEQELKHDLLAKADPRGPSRFSYVTPPGLLEYELLPPWAGWFEVYPYDPAASNGTLLLRERVQAPHIHRLKITADPNHFRGTCYYRMHRGGWSRIDVPLPESPPGAGASAA